MKPLSSRRERGTRANAKRPKADADERVRPPARLCSAIICVFVCFPRLVDSDISHHTNSLLSAGQRFRDNPVAVICLLASFRATRSKIIVLSDQNSSSVSRIWTSMLSDQPNNVLFNPF